MGVLRVWNGSGWDEIKGERGDSGASAYQIAVNEGFVGTEQEWLDSLAARVEDIEEAVESSQTVAQLRTDVDVLSVEVDGVYTKSETDVLLGGKANSSHTHSMGQISGLSSALNGKANTSHTHTIANVTGLQNAINGKADSNHRHAATSFFVQTHTTTQSTSARSAPGTEHWVVSNLGSGWGVTRLGTVAISSGGITWWQCHSNQGGICWINSAHLTAI